MLRRGKYRSGLDRILKSGTMQEREAAISLEGHLQLLGAGLVRSSFVKGDGDISLTHCINEEKNTHLQIQVRKKLMRWMEKLRDEDCARDAVLQILLNGESFSRMDRKMKKRNGWARSETGRALMIFQSLR